ncbi:MAG: peptidase S10 [Planctomycetota bacterium]|nr:MAG: peptidase S10 [Planctomycetota bacterium]
MQIAASLTLLFLAAPLFAQEESPTAGSTPIPDPLLFYTGHEGTFHGVDVSYEAIAGETYLRDDDGNPTATIFSTSYIMEDVEDPTTRAVTFLWNGGPGSASVWLHMGAFGPVRVDIPSDARDDGAPPYSLIANPGTFLDLSDIVFIDPVGTGFSRPLGDAEGKDFYGVKQDAESIAQFIRLWLTEHRRWNSPKFIGGESYGTTRAAAVARELEAGFDDVALNGILLISTILDFSIENHTAGNELPSLMHLPTMAATAKYHGKAGDGVALEDFVQQARDYALNEYAHALLQGNSLSDAERKAVRKKLSSFTGLSESFLDRNDLRLQPGRFQKELLREQGLTVGRLDSRYTGVDLDSAGERSDQDPSFYGIDGAYAVAINHHLQNNLDVDIDRHYNIIGGLGGSWDWKVPGIPFNYFNLAPWIGRAMRENQDLEVYVAAGYYDFATPFFAAEYSLNRAGIVPERLHFYYYEAGHMMYIHHPSLHKMQDDIHDFLESALNR